MKIYIAGPITGIFDYREKFSKAEKELIDMGHTVINPAYLPTGLNHYMPICKAMIDQCDSVYFLKGWEASIGAVEEYNYSIEKGEINHFFQEVAK